MEELNGVTIYWLISIGLFIGYVIDLIMIKQGIGLFGNLIGGVTGAILIGATAILAGIFAPLIYATMGSLTFLFLVNVFSIRHTEQFDAKID